MKRMYFLADTLESVERVWHNLREIDIAEGAFHIVTKDDDGIQRHKMSTAGAFVRTDLIHSGEQGALVGTLLGLAFATWLVVTEPFGLQVGWFGFLFAAAMFGFHGAWVGGMVGLAQENYKLKPFHNAIEKGKYLLMVDIGTPQQENLVRMIIRMQHPELIYEGEDTLGSNPFQRKTAFQPVHPM